MIKSVCHEESEQLIGHIPIEISQLINYFLEAVTTNTMTAVVTGKRKREIAGTAEPGGLGGLGGAAPPLF